VRSFEHKEGPLQKWGDHKKQTKKERGRKRGEEKYTRQRAVGEKTGRKEEGGTPAVYASRYQEGGGGEYVIRKTTAGGHQRNESMARKEVKPKQEKKGAP